jgi:photoactive yellow protein
MPHHEQALVESQSRVAALHYRRDSKYQKARVENLQERGGSMTAATIDFNAPDLAARIEQVSQHDLDNLPFGVIQLDRDGTVLFYSATEARLSGYGEVPLGQNLFDISRCMKGDDFRGRLTRAMEEGPVDLEFGWPGDYADPARELRIRVQSSRTGGVWMFIERDVLPGA